MDLSLSLSLSRSLWSYPSLFFTLHGLISFCLTLYGHISVSLSHPHLSVPFLSVFLRIKIHSIIFPFATQQQQQQQHARAHKLFFKNSQNIKEELFSEEKEKKDFFKINCNSRFCIIFSTLHLIQINRVSKKTGLVKLHLKRIV